MITEVTISGTALSISTDNILYIYTDGLGDNYACIDYFTAPPEIVQIAEDATDYVGGDFIVLPHATLAYLLVNSARVKGVNPLGSDSRIAFNCNGMYQVFLDIDDTPANVETDINTALELGLVTDGDKGDVIVSGGGTIWTVVGGGGGGGYTIITVNFASSPYTILPTTGITLYQVDCTGGNVIMNFPTAISSTAIWGVKKIDSSLNTITLEPFGAQTIDGNANQTILFQNTQVDIYSDNVNLFIK